MVKRKRRVKSKPKARAKPVTVPMDPESWVKDAKQIAALRGRLSKEQGGLDPVLNEPLIRACLDHDHFSGECRGVLSQCVNTFEGYILKAWMKYVADKTETTLTDALRNMADYLEKDYSHQPLHGKHKDDMLKFLRRCNNETIKARALADLGLAIPDEAEKQDSVLLYLTEFVKQAEEAR